MFLGYHNIKGIILLLYEYKAEAQVYSNSSPRWRQQTILVEIEYGIDIVESVFI